MFDHSIILTQARSNVFNWIHDASNYLSLWILSNFSWFDQFILFQENLNLISYVSWQLWSQVHSDCLAL